MTLVSDIIKRAYRESNLIPLVSDPSANQSDEALSLLNSIILSTVGNEVSDSLYSLNYGGANDQSSYTSPSIPDGARLVFNLDSSVTLYADPYPYEGQRMGFVDILGNLNTYPVTIDGNGRNIEGLYTVLLDTDGDIRQWLYRADIGNWVKIEALTEVDEMPFGIEFDDYFSIALAIRLNPRYGQMAAPETMQAFARTKRQFQARYSTKKPVKSDLSGQNWYADQNAYDGYNDSNFSLGRPRSWL